MDSAAHATRHRLRLVLFLTSAVAVFGTMYVLNAGVNTLHRLDVVEAERDIWQRPADVLRALDVHPGNVVVDLGSGAGYFSLKMSPIVGSHGQVLAVDLRKLSLTFLWIRAAMRSSHNVRVVLGEANDPHLPANRVDAVLISNTFHEFQDPEAMLHHVLLALRPGGRLLILDRAPNSSDAGPAENEHHLALESVTQTILKAGFQISVADCRFIDRPREDLWWLLVARKP